MDVRHRRRAWLRLGVFVAFTAPVFIAAPVYAGSRSVEIQVTLVVTPSCTFPSAAALAAGASPQCGVGGVKPELSYTREPMSSFQAAPVPPVPMIAALTAVTPNVARRESVLPPEEKSAIDLWNVPDLDIVTATAGQEHRVRDAEALLVTVNF